jgi:transposase
MTKFVAKQLNNTTVFTEEERPQGVPLFFCFMGRKSRFIKNLTVDQVGALKWGYSHGKSPLFRRKCHCIIQSNSGKTPGQLADFFQVNKMTVLNWFNLWALDGIEGLQLKPGRGRKPKLNTDDRRHVSVVKELISNENQNLTKVQSQIQGQLGIELSKKTLQCF